MSGAPALRARRRGRAPRAQDDLERAVDVESRDGEFVALLGANGSGKSTLLKALLGALPLRAGRDRGARRGRRARQTRRSATCRSGARSRRARGCAASTSCGSGSTATAGGCRCRCCGARPRARARGARARVAEAIELVGASAYARAPDRRALGRRAAAPADRPGARAPPAAAAARRAARQPRPAQPGRGGGARGRRSAARQGVAVLLVAHDVNPLLAYLDRVVYLAGGRAVEGPVERGDHERDAERVCTACRSRCCAPPTGGSSWSGSRSRRRTTTTATSHGHARARPCRLTRSTRR